MENWTQIMAGMIDQGVFPQHVHRVLLWSTEPGTGKSSYAHHKLGSERCERVTLHGRMTPDDLLYQVDLEQGDKGGTNTVRRAGPALRALIEGKILVLDEIDQHDPAMRCLLHALLDDKAIAGVTLPDGQRIVPKEGFAVIATTNKQPANFPAPLLDRFDVVLNCSQPNVAAFQGLPAGVVKALVNQYARIQVQHWSAPLSVRRGVAYSKLAKHLGNEKAAQVVFGAAWSDVLNSFAAAESAPITKVTK